MRKILLILLATLLASCSSTPKIENSSTAKYTTQILEPTGGTVEKPTDWFYQERHRSPDSLAWVISKEDPSKGYETGLSIQFMLGLEKHTGKKPKEFVLKTISERSKSAIVLSQCEPQVVGIFTRICLETEETRPFKGAPIKFHVKYAFFWGNSTDMVGITMAGAPVEKWADNIEIFDHMSAIELIDPSRF